MLRGTCNKNFEGIVDSNMRIQKFFNNKDTGSLITVADVFGYVIAFFVLWLFILAYRAVSRVGEHVPNISKIKIELLEKAKPNINETTKVPAQASETTQEAPASKKAKLTDTAIEVLANTKDKASQLLSKEGAQETIFSVNTYLNSLIQSVSSNSSDTDDQPTRAKPRPSEDTLSSF